MMVLKAPSCGSVVIENPFVMYVQSALLVSVGASWEGREGDEQWSPSLLPGSNLVLPTLRPSHKAAS